MFRVAVAMYLMIVTAVGPAACCCTLTRLAARLTAPSTPPAPSCCHARQGESPKDESGQHTRPERPDAPRCPCQEGVAGEASALPPAADDALEISERGTSGPSNHLVAILLATGVPPPRASSDYWGAAGAPPPKSTDDLLYAFHMLRC